MKVCLLGGSFASMNLGLEALTRSLASSVWDAEPEAEISIFDFVRGSDLQSTPTARGMRTVRRHGLNPGRRYWRTDTLSTMEVMASLGLALGPGLRDLRAADVVIDISGGDSFTDLYGERRMGTQSRIKELVLRLGKPLVLGPQTYGPFNHQTSQERAARILRAAHQVWARDEDSATRARATGGEHLNVHTGVDLAFALPKTLHEPLLEQLGAFGGGEVVGLNVSGLLWFQSRDPESSLGLTVDYPRMVQGIVEGLFERGVQGIVLVPHVLEPEGSYESDREASQLLRSRLPAEAQARVRVLQGPYGASEVKGLMSQLSWFAGSRMHATIGALSSAVPTVGLAYSLKFKGVFESAGAGSSVVELRELSTEAAIEQTLTAYDQRESLSESLPHSAERLRSAATRQVAQMVSAVRESGGD